jgi:hypothetical protein
MLDIVLRVLAGWFALSLLAGLLFSTVRRIDRQND